jgi:cytoskeleton protein RodZ
LASLAAVGARLTQLRESKGLSIDDVSARLKVPAARLRALEAGDISHFPDTTFALGVVRGYAKMLGADPVPFAQAMRREKGMPEPDLSMPASSGTGLPRGRMSVSLGGAPQHRSWLWGIAAVVVAVIALAMWHTNGGESSAWLARLKASANGAAANSNSASATVALDQAASTVDKVEGAAATTNDGASQVPMPAPLPAATAPSPAAPDAAVIVAQPPGAGQPAAQGVAPQEDAAAAPPPVAAQATVGIKVSQDSWFSVRQQDGKEVFSGLMRAGESKEITGIAPFKLTVGNKAGLDSISLDGQPVDPARYSAAKGNVVRFVLP